MEKHNPGLKELASLLLRATLRRFSIDAHLLNIFTGFAIFCISNIFSAFLHILGSPLK